jgi:hypothetical protein
MKRPTLTDITTLSGAYVAINANNRAIEEAFDNVLSLDGATPNAMKADLDMNSNDLLNVNTVSALRFNLNGVYITPSTTITTAPFASRSEFITWNNANLVPLPIGSVRFFPGASGSSLAYVYLGSGTVIPDAPGWTWFGFMHLDHFRSTVSVANTDIAITNSFAFLNTSGGALYFPSGIVNINSQPPAISHSDVELIGQETRLIFASSGSGTNGNFIRVGTASTNVQRISIRGITFQCNNTPLITEYAIRFDNCSDIQTSNLGFVNVACVACFGWDEIPLSPTSAVRVVADLGNGNFNKGLNADANIRFKYAASCTLTGILNGGGGACNTNATGAIVLIEPVAGGVCDTITFSNFKVQAFSNSTPGSADGKPYGIRWNSRYGAVTNIFIEDGCVVDHTTVAAYSGTDEAGSTSNCRNHMINGLRACPDNGVAVSLVKVSADPAALWVSHRISGCHLEVVGPSPAISVSGAGYRQCSVVDTTIQDTTSTVKPRAIDIASDGWFFGGNSFGPNTSTATAFTVAIEITNAAIVDITIDQNYYHPGIVSPIKEPSVFTTPNAPRRRINGPNRSDAVAYITPNTGEYTHTCGAGTTATGTQQGAANRMDLYPWVCPAEVTITALAVAVTTGVASALGKIIVYNADAKQRPSGLVFESGNLDLSTISSPEAAFSFTFKKGVTYWFGFRHSSTATLATWALGSTPELPSTTFSGGARNRVLRQTLAYGTAAPSTWTYSTADAVTVNPIAIGLKVA